MSVALTGVGTKRADRALVQRDLSLLVLFARAHVQRAVGEVDVLAVERECLPGGDSR